MNSVAISRFLGEFPSTQMTPEVLLLGFANLCLQCFVSVSSRLVAARCCTDHTSNRTHSITSPSPPPQPPQTLLTQNAKAISNRHYHTMYNPPFFPLYITDSPHSPPPSYSRRLADSPSPARTPDWYRTGCRAPWGSQTCCPSLAPSLDRGMRGRVLRCCCMLVGGFGRSGAARGRQLPLRVVVAAAAAAWVVERRFVAANCSPDS